MIKTIAAVKKLLFGMAASELRLTSSEKRQRTLVTDKVNTLCVEFPVSPRTAPSVISCSVLGGHQETEVRLPKIEIPHSKEVVELRESNLGSMLIHHFGKCTCLRLL